jgi:nitroreductase
METLEAILTRRSVRKYRPDPVPETLLHNLLKAAMNAPSAGNERAWQFLVINQRSLLDQIPSIHPHAQMLTEVPLAIVICGDLSREQHPGCWVQDCSAATENLLLAAHDQGLGTVWIGIYPREERMTSLQELVHLPGNIIPFSLVPVGYPDETKPHEDRFDLSRVRYNRW